MPSRLDDELTRLVSAGVLRQFQADALRSAAAADFDTAPASTQGFSEPTTPGPHGSHPPQRTRPP